MTEISLEKLSALVAVGEKLKKLAQETPEVIEYLRLVKGVEVLPMKSDVLVRALGAAKILCVSKVYRYLSGENFNADVHAIKSADEILA